MDGQAAPAAAGVVVEVVGAEAAALGAVVVDVVAGTAVVVGSAAASAADSAGAVVVGSAAVVVEAPPVWAPAEVRRRPRMAAPPAANIAQLTQIAKKLFRMGITLGPFLWCQLRAPLDQAHNRESGREERRPRRKMVAHKNFPTGDEPART